MYLTFLKYCFSLLLY